MTNPPQGSDEPGPIGPGQNPGELPDPDRHPTQPVPPVGPPQQPYGDYGQPRPGPGGAYGQPYGQPPSQPYGQYGHQPYGQAPQHGPAPYGQPQYGQPQYGAAPEPHGQPAASPKSRVGLIAAVTAGILLLIAVGVVLALNMSSTVLDRTAVQQDVAVQFEEREGVAVDLECAEEMKVTSGATYECTGTTADGEDVTLQIAITDEQTAAYTWTEP
ncbi:uncharacterized protein DUF4333 [Blastococcus colisei]|uniref:Uncharacterized protein DUF4333 n=1 Tax=Blastococcus colisei TaxID=1564162 RepID=A0A543PG06_9ACTN|nr:DUF4333 domain-containing protein [Blastococcus colisei]TQN43000.1 uncharacterized protein DUF4333 [Blastococcus colisei]